MPLKRGKKNISRNISELHRGPMYRRNVRKFGAKRARKIAIATALAVSRRRR